MNAKILIANWKANPSTLAEARELFQAEIIEAAKYKNIRTVICPPFVYLEELAKQLSAKSYKLSASLGAQDVFWKESGPFTGEVSTEMLKNFGVSHVLVGHSDRRYILGETDEMINKKMKAALEAGIVPVLLVGEKNRADDRRQVLEKQLSADFADLTADQVSKVLIAYEPVWAISTTPGAEPDTPESTLEAISLVNNFLTIRYTLNSRPCLYGGSVTEKNVADFLSHPEISGAVVGGASLRKDEFVGILRIVSEI
jgi:triosephosphate isomerase